MCCTWLAANTGCKNYAKKIPICTPSHNLLGNIFASKACIDSRKKNLLHSNISSICLYSTVNVGPLTAEICWRVLGTPANFNGFCVLASLLQRHRSTEVNKTLQDVWPSPALVYYTCIFGCLCPLIEFCPLQNSLSV